MHANDGNVGHERQGPLQPRVRTHHGLLVRRDQLKAIRSSVLQAIPVNLLLGLAGCAVAIHAGIAQPGLIWFAASALINVARVMICMTPCPGMTEGLPDASSAASVDQHLRYACAGALASGFVWALLPLLCAGYTSPQTLFYLTVTCGITAGAVTYGTAYARVPICFITLPLLSVAGCLFVVGDFDRLCLAFTVLLYLAALIKGTLATERVFREASRSKNEAKAAADSREAARTDATALAKEMEWRATHDDLTGLLNRAGLTAAFDAASSKGMDRPCLMLLDLDGFKSVNDVYGHKMGDRVLTVVAGRLKAQLSPSCQASRLGGDEFAIFFDATLQENSPAAIAACLIAAIAEPFDGFDVGRMGVSIGIDDSGACDLTGMLSHADAALYAAKHRGRNRFHVFDDGLNRRLGRLRDAKRDLAKALSCDQTEIWLQPIFAKGGHALAGFEALIRWRHPEHGWISPEEIVKVAGTKGLAEALLRFILDRVCDTIRILRDAGREDLRVAMNVSPRELAQLAVDEIVLGALRQFDLPTSMLEIEVTEETALDIEAVRARLITLRRAGVTIALDDFGAGYSSLASIHQLQIHRVKIDRSLVSGLANDPSRRKMVEAVIGLGQSLQLEVVAEGVETGEDLAALRSAGCQLMQGYLLGRPTQMHQALSLAGL